MNNRDAEHESFLEALVEGAAEILDEAEDALDRALRKTGHALDEHKDLLIPLISAAFDALLTHHAPRNKALARYLNGTAKGVAADVAAHFAHHFAVYASTGKTYDLQKDAAKIADNAVLSIVRAHGSAPSR